MPVEVPPWAWEGEDSKERAGPLGFGWLAALWAEEALRFGHSVSAPQPHLSAAPSDMGPPLWKGLLPCRLQVVPQRWTERDRTLGEITASSLPFLHLNMYGLGAREGLQGSRLKTALLVFGEASSPFAHIPLGLSWDRLPRWAKGNAGGGLAGPRTNGLVPTPRLLRMWGG